MAYRVGLEMAKSKRAICRNTECKKQSIKIDKGELRLGSWVDYGENQGFAWKHWGCVTPLQIASIKDATEDDLDMLDGYEELPDDLQEKVKQSIENGHVSDEDWRGDLEQNRPGMKGFRSPAAKKARKKIANEEETGVDDRGNSPSKPAPKKRGRAKKEELEHEAEEPAKKKPRTTAKKGKKVKSEEDMDEATVDEPAAVPIQAVAEKGKQAQFKETDSREDVKPRAKAAAKKVKDAVEEAATDVDLAAAAAPKKAKAAGKKGQKTEEAETEAPQKGVQPKKARGRPPKSMADKVNDVDGPGPGTEQDDQPTKASKKAVVTTNAANTKKLIARKTGKNFDAETAEAPAEEIPKAAIGRKKVNRSKKS
ncbi:MAG: hypothetical protein Q9185_004432 [Variospora sp. 1 TL-2023]